MKIRSITCFLDPGWPLQEAALDRAGEFVSAARPALESTGYEVQSARLASGPFPHLLPALDQASLVSLARGLEAAGRSRGFDYMALGPALPERLESYALIPEALAAAENMFFCGLMTTPQGGVSLPAVRACAGVIEQVKSLSPDGFANLRFAAAANLAPGGPFLPTAYHRGGPPEFALAAQAADLAVEAFSSAGSLAEAGRLLVAAMEDHARRLSDVCTGLSARWGVNFGGLDLTLAPFPDQALSIGTALERLGLPAVGLHGSLAAAAFLMDTADRAEYRRAGFNGLMLPVLEDAVLAERAAQGRLSVRDLLLYASVCGTGLDTVPLPGDARAAELAAVLLDVAALAQRLDKPLTARLMPVPGKRAGDPTGFDFAYFANSRVLSLEAEPLNGLLAGEETIRLRPRR